jgi:hypothetical protein
MKQYRVGRVNPWWSAEFKKLDYEYYPTTNPEDNAEWVRQGYGRLDFNSGAYTMAKPMPDYADEFFKIFDWKNIALRFYRMMPWEGLPMHQDHYTGYRRTYNINDPALCCRCVVFLEDWKSGHYLEVDGNAVANWRAGDYVYWNYDVPHYAANFGTEPRYSLQITGTQKR